MTKKLLWLLFIVILLLFAGGLLYWKMAHVPPPSSPVATNWPASVPFPPSSSPAAPAGRPAGPPAAAETSNKREPAPAEPSFVLRQGEALEYDANVTKLNSTVARLRISAVEKRTTAGKGIWHLQALAHTENPYRMVFELDDQFDSYSDAGTMTSVQYEMHLSERGQKVDSVQRMLSSMQDPVPPGGSAARVLPGTRDPLGMLAYLRSVDWAHTSEVRCPVYDGHKLYDVRAVLVGKSAGVTVPAGKFNTTKIEIHVLDNGTEMKDAHFILYLTSDGTRLPVLMEAVLPVATARVELTKAK
ncbi:MAG TPA: DUF3108 domain-containing protein [Candidatus Sulfotelmatobacter sp.]|nr:DUF3108 domain-containing protein [Candidatus Sulfotelmatobacter sp.]